MFRPFLIALVLFLSMGLNLEIKSQTPIEEIKKIIAQSKVDQRGPYKDIRWFCKDGSIIPPREKCKEPGGYQRARYGDQIVKLMEKDHLFLGQILMGTEKEDFFDNTNQQSRLKQYILQTYLQSVDDGWINQKAKFYRGAIQIEDEESWGKEFLEWMAGKDNFSKEKFYLMRESTKYIPHGEQNNLVLSIRSLSKTIADRYAPFMDLRTKIHGNPGPGDIASVRQFLEKNRQKMDEQSKKEMEKLLSDMDKYYNVPITNQLKNLVKALKASPIKEELNFYTTIASNLKDKEENIIRLVDLTAEIKNEIEKPSLDGKQRLQLLDISLLLESETLKSMSDWQPSDLKSNMKKSCYASQLSNATGYIYDWEFEELVGHFSSINKDEISLDELIKLFRGIRKNINWGSALIMTEFGNVLERYSTFEPLADGFVDDRIRSSSLLILGQMAANLNEYIAEKANWKNEIFDSKSSSLQGVNPGFAKGKLIVVDRLDEHNVDPLAIYVFKESPADLEPVAGILSISEGNMVSHVQLLARNLGIPNATISDKDFSQLKSKNGQEVFYAVSNRGGVMIKRSEDMTQEEKALFAKKQVDEEIISVPTDQLKLDEIRIFPLSEIDASSSGIICGPKAANFARLKKIFPQDLVDGMVIPFSVFKDHMLQTIPERNESYWAFLTETFEKQADIKDESEREQYTLGRLAELRAFIKDIPLKKDLLNDLERSFVKIFGKALGEVPVFLRSDTNMEDLKDFTGAGLNLTVFNTISKDKILQGIRDVWASPYSERSYKWRQKFLNNPQDVYPSILVIPSVFVDYSGVIITKDFIEGSQGKLNVAFSQGAGGAVDGQKSESWILDPNKGRTLVAPARDRMYKYLSKKGGTELGVSVLSEPILKQENMDDIWRVCSTIYSEMPKTGMSYPYDIELGFEKDKLWLFQIRPFVENKKATSSFYLSKLDPVIPEDLKIKTNAKM